MIFLFVISDSPIIAPRREKKNSFQTSAVSLYKMDSYEL